MAWFRRPRLVKRAADGGVEVIMGEPEREVVGVLLDQLVEQLDQAPDADALRRLHPPAYLEDDGRDAEYQLLAGEELRSSRRDAISTVRRSLHTRRLSEDEAWAWLQALNAVRLVVGTELEISDDGTEQIDPEALSPQDQSLWAIYHFTTYLQHELVEALSG